MFNEYKDIFTAYGLNLARLKQFRTKEVVTCLTLEMQDRDNVSKPRMRMSLSHLQNQYFRI